MGDKVKIDHPDKYKISEKLTALATTPQQKSWLQRIAAAKVPDDTIEVGVTKFKTLTDEQFAEWVTKNKGKKFVLPQVRIAHNDMTVLFNEERVRDIEKGGETDDSIARTIVSMIVAGLTEKPSSTGQTSYTFSKPVEVKDQ
jgi:hypothetical protein